MIYTIFEGLIFKIFFHKESGFMDEGSFLNTEKLVTAIYLL